MDKFDFMIIVSNMFDELGTEEEIEKRRKEMHITIDLTSKLTIDYLKEGLS